MLYFVVGFTGLIVGSFTGIVLTCIMASSGRDSRLREQENKKSGKFECMNCLQRAVVWEGDFDFSDYGYEGDGIIHICRCQNCGAEIEYRIGGDEE